MAVETYPTMYNMWGRSATADVRWDADRFQRALNTASDRLPGAYYVKASEQIASTANALARERRWQGVGPKPAVWPRMR
jgi:ElaB/YqjD/DUF883 family membrane-anchored ribosome-binding protein